MFRVIDGRFSDMETFQVALIPIGEATWAAMLSTGQMILSSTKRPRMEVAAELLLNGADPRARLVIHSGAKMIANDVLGSLGGSPVVCGTDVGAMERD